uniref:Uncharacterized protein n=1 Tax=Oryza nivara TaxID=4536 RepID=A0A0E0HSY3_ORYNI
MWRTRSRGSGAAARRDFGSSPLRLLLMSISTWRDELFAKDSGMLPVRKLLPRSTYLREKLLPRNGGMPPRLYIRDAYIA